MGETPSAGRTHFERPPHQATQLLRRIVAANQRVERALGRHLSVNETDFRAMALLLNHGTLTQGALAEYLHMSPASATLIVDRLEALGHAERHRDHHDRRRVMVTPSQASTQEALAALMPMITRADDVAVRLDQHQQQGLIEFLTGALAALEECEREFTATDNTDR